MWSEGGCLSRKDSFSLEESQLSGRGDFQVGRGYHSADVTAGQGPKPWDMQFRRGLLCPGHLEKVRTGSQFEDIWVSRQGPISRPEIGGSER